MSVKNLNVFFFSKGFMEYLVAFEKKYRGTNTINAREYRFFFSFFLSFSLISYFFFFSFSHPLPSSHRNGRFEEKFFKKEMVDALWERNVGDE